MEKLLHIIKKYIPHKLFKALQPVYHFCLSALAALCYGWPSSKLIVIGVTGTTGKTTSVYLMTKTLASAGYKVGFTSTAMFNDGRNEWLNNKKMTMPGRFFTQKILKQMVNHGCQYAIVETTSEGIKQYRHRFINYDILIFTGLYAEHIESHGSFANYKSAKGKLFEHLKHGKTKYGDDKKIISRGISGLKKIELNRVKKTMIVNLDDENADYFLNFWAEEKLGYTNRHEYPPKLLRQPKAGPPSAGDQPLADKTNLTKENLKVVFYGGIEAQCSGVSFVTEGIKIRLKLLGEFNATNAMNAVCLGLSQGLNVEQIKKGLECIAGIPGRFESVQLGQPFTVIVDYAFEPKAVTKLYETISAIPHKKVIHVLGSAGGGRDVARRPLLGKIAGEKADLVIVTNEDPYDDNPEIIIDQVALGAAKAGKILEQNLFKIMDRRQAIRKALTSAKAGDIVLLTGKGSEQAICIADGVKLPWDDRKVVKEEMEKLHLISNPTP